MGVRDTVHNIGGVCRIGRACTAKYGTRFGKIFEGVFAIPQYIGVALGNGIGYMAYIIRGSPQKIEAKKARRATRRAASNQLSIINKSYQFPA
jgi:hypothetical protein